MEHLVENFVRSIADLKVHQRTAGNIREQLLIIARGQESGSRSAVRTLCSSLKETIEKLQAISQLLPFQGYLRQGEVSDLLDSLHEACWEYTKASDDDFLREDINTQRKIYKSDHDADMIGIKRLLRDALRQNDARQQLSQLTPDEVAAVRSAIYLELKSLADGEQNSRAKCLFTEALSRLDLGLKRVSISRSLLDLTGEIYKISSRPIAWGAICGVWTGELYGKKVSLQSPINHMVHSPGYSEGVVLANAMAWASFNHPNVLPLLGFSKDLDRLALVAPWMKNGNVDHYLRVNPKADRFKLIMELASGLLYLHSRSPPYIHGVLSGEGVLINEDGQAVIGAFASATFEKNIHGNLRFQPPEALRNEDYEYSMASDVYQFAMTALQIMTKARPFSEISSPTKVVELLESGMRPKRPNWKLIHHGLDGKLWSLISRCWAQDRRARPSMSEIVEELERMRELPALDVRDLTGSIELSSDSLSDVRACGGFGDIRVGLLDDVGPVALKTLNIKGKAQPALRHTKRFFREASIWKSLSHPNVLPFLGTADPPGLSTCLVSPWMENGNLMEFMKGHPDEPLLYIARGIAYGLAYLHAQVPHPVIHGDLRAANVLISNEGEPLLCDFGLAVVIEDLVQLPISSVLQDAGNPRWMAPELFIGVQPVSKASDIWALGMVLLEMMSNDVPYSELKSSAQVIVEVHKGRLPSRPSGGDVVRRGLSDELWELMMKCWNHVPDDRPSAADAQRAIEMLASDAV